MDYTNEQLQKIIDTATALQHANDDFADANAALSAAQDAVDNSAALVNDLSAELKALTTPAPAAARRPR